MFLISVVSVLILTANAPADTFIWDNGGEGNLWNVPENWEPDGLPTSADDARIEDPNATCLIDSSVAAECTTVYVDGSSYLEMTGGTLAMDSYLRIGYASDSNSLMVMSGGVANIGTDNQTNGRLWLGINGTGTLIMRGGELNIYDKTEIGRNSGGGYGILYMEGGTINFNGNSADLELAKTGEAVIYITGGVLNVQDFIKLGQEGGTASIYLNGGTINASNLRSVADCSGTGLIDITEGTLIFNNADRREVVNEFINAGWLVAYDGLGILNVTYTADPNQTVVTAANLPPELASFPSPRHRSTVSRPVTLDWAPGIYAASHDVYFGTDPNVVSDANSVPGLWPEFKGNQDSNNFDPGALELGRTYYWRIDEVNETDPNSPWKGMVWEFKVGDYIIVEGFESYNEIPETEPESNLVYYTWMDGYLDNTNGSTIGYVVGDSLETDDVHGGNQAAPFGYNNTTASYSEITVNIADLGVSGDWSVDNLGVLSLWFYGGPLNMVDGQSLYIKVNGAKVVYDGQIDDLTQPSWQEWRIDLSDFGIDLSNVTELGIGVEKTGGTSGSGTILIDDIRLYVAGD
jgi:hypothetical protein